MPKLDLVALSSSINIASTSILKNTDVVSNNLNDATSNASTAITEAASQVESATTTLSRAAGAAMAAASYSLDQAATEIANSISAGVSVDLDAAAQGLGHDSFASAVEAYNEQYGTSYTVDSAKEAFGVMPPDLTLIARSRGSEWLYTFLTSFYKDETRPLGVNNALYANVGMPHVLSWMEGLKKPVNLEKGQYEYVVEGTMTDKEYKKSITDLVNFLAYVSEPAQLDRYRIGFWVILFLAIFSFLAFLLKIEYWKDVK